MDDKKLLTSRTVIICAVFLLSAVLSIAVPGRYFSRPESYSGSVQELDEKKSDVEKLAGAAIAASAAISLMPGDFGTPIADKLADLSGYFLFILCAIYVEKFLVSVAGILAFDILIPIGLVLLAVNLFWPSRLKTIAIRLMALGCVLLFLVPGSLKISNLVEKQYEDEIQQTIDTANQETETLKDTADRSDDGSLWADFTAKIKGGSAAVVSKIEETLNSFIDVIAVYIVTSCVIPAAVLLVGIWIIKMLFHLDLRVPRIPSAGRYTTRVIRDRLQDHGKNSEE